MNVVCKECGQLAWREEVRINLHEPDINRNGLGKVMRFIGQDTIIAAAAFNLIHCGHCGEKTLEIVCQHDTTTSSH